MNDSILAALSGLFIGIGAVILDLSVRQTISLYFFLIGIYFFIKSVL